MVVLSIGCGDSTDRPNETDENNATECQLATTDELVPCSNDDNAPECECAVTNIDVEDFGPTCEIERICGKQVGVDCGSAADGPYYYVDGETGDIMERCGGYCFAANPAPGECESCPPQDWTCETY